MSKSTLCTWLPVWNKDEQTVNDVSPFGSLGIISWWFYPHDNMRTHGCSLHLAKQSNSTSIWNWITYWIETFSGGQQLLFITQAIIKDISDSEIHCRNLNTDSRVSNYTDSWEHHGLHGLWPGPWLICVKVSCALSGIIWKWEHHWKQIISQKPVCVATSSVSIHEFPECPSMLKAENTYIWI